MNLIEQTRLSLLKKGRKIINLSSGNPNENGIFFPAKILQKGLKRFLENPTYLPDPKGDLTARKAIKSFYQKRGLNLTPDQIILTSGSSESYLHLFKMLTKPGEKILFPKPTYPLFAEIANITDTHLSFYNLNEKDGWQIDCAHLEAQIGPEVKAIVLISPSNPTGAVLHAATLKKVLEIAKKHHLVIISDEVFSEFIFNTATASQGSTAVGINFPRIAKMSSEIDIFTINGISKTYALPGLKLSWIVATGPNQKDYIEQLERTIDALLSANQISQTLLPTIIKNGQTFLKSFRKKVIKNRDLAVRILEQCPQISFHKPEGGFYLFAKIRPGAGKNQHLTDEQFVIKLMQKTAIFAHPGYFYDYDQEIFILISLLFPPKVLEESLETIVAFIQSC